MEMITVPSGAFSMGITEQQIQFLLPLSAWAANWLEKGFFSREQPAHELILAPYSIGKYPVTVGDYQAFVEDGGYAKPRYWPKGSEAATRGKINEVFAVQKCFQSVFCPRLDRHIWAL